MYVYFLSIKAKKKHREDRASFEIEIFCQIDFTSSQVLQVKQIFSSRDKAKSKYIIELPFIVVKTYLFVFGTYSL